MGGNHIYVKDTRDASQPLVLYRLFRGNLPFLVESKPNAFLTGSKPAFHTKSSTSKPNAFLTESSASKPNAFLTESSASKPNAFTDPKPSTSLTAYSHWHKAS